ncbi:MAG: SH3 domain-containing protein [Desulfobacteraceae bacterium]|nr:SH3 domain-containing protein [Desulfobacteraceae bacterium]
MLVILLATCMLSVGCLTTKKETGAVVGTVLGAAAGMLIGDGAGRAVAVGVGAILGGVIGNQIGKYLDEQDRLAVEKESAKALSQSKDGETVTWENPETKAEAEITVQKTETVKRSIPIVRHKEVAKPKDLKLIGEPYEILTNANVRFGPSMDYAVAKVLKKGTVVLAVGQVKNRNWILINQDRYAIGYIHASLVDKEGSTDTITKGKQPEEDKPIASMRPAVNLDDLSNDMDSAQTLRPAVDLDGMVATYPENETTKEFVAEEVEVEAPARTITMKVSTPKGEEEKTFVASKSSDGAWEIL